MNLPSALVYSTRLRVSVCGTGTFMVELSGFSRELAYLRCHAARRLCVLSGSALAVDLPAAISAYAFNALFRQRAGVSLLRLRIAHKGSKGILTFLPSASPFGLSLGPD